MRNHVVLQQGRRPVVFRQAQHPLDITRGNEIAARAEAELGFDDPADQGAVCRPHVMDGCIGVGAEVPALKASAFPRRRNRLRAGGE